MHGFNAAKTKEIEGVSPSVMQALMEFNFPGNVRELQNIIEHAFVLCDTGLIDVQHLPRDVTTKLEGTLSDTPSANDKTVSPRTSLAATEVAAIRAALAHNRGHRARTASDLGISPSTLWRKMRRYSIEG